MADYGAMELIRGHVSREDECSCPSLMSSRFNANKAIMRVSCINLGADNGPDNSDEEIGQIWNAIQAASYQTQVDHRFISAILMQGSKGCVRVRTTNNGVTNPGFLQTHDG